MKYQHRFQVKAPLQTVAEFHSDSSSMAAITPPPIKVQIHHAPSALAQGDEMDFTLWLGPIPIHWLARIERLGNFSLGFIDRQVRGPFQTWVHTHTFEAIDDHTTLVIDDIDWQPRRHLWWGLVGLGMGLSLPLLFAYRSWRTKQLLQSNLTQLQPE